VDFLEDLGAEAYKISSFEITDIPLIEYAAGKGKPMIISAGMAEKDEIARAVEAVRGQGNEDVILLKCTSEYPAKAEDMNLAAIPDMAGSFGLPVGLSDHSLGGGAAVAAVLLGAVVIEKHFCLSREIKSPDSDFSMEPEEFLRMAEDVRRAAAMRGGVRYGPVGDELSSLRFRRSIFAVRDIRAGETFTEENVRVIRPCYGLAPACYPAVLGTACKRELKRGDPVTEDAVCVKLK
jgi:sialic acid synthase SpsE